MAEASSFCKCGGREREGPGRTLQRGNRSPDPVGSWGGEGADFQPLEAPAWESVERARRALVGRGAAVHTRLVEEQTTCLFQAPLLLSEGRVSKHRSLGSFCFLQGN